MSRVSPRLKVAIVAGGIILVGFIMAIPIVQQELKHAALSEEQRTKLFIFEQRCEGRVQMLSGSLKTAGEETCRAVIDQATLEYRSGKSSSLIDGYADPGEPRIGVLVLTVSEESRATSAGIEPQSIILYVGEQEVGSLEDLGEILRANLGKTVDLTLVNNSGEKITRQIPLPESVPLNQGILGVTVIPLS